MLTNTPHRWEKHAIFVKSPVYGCNLVSHKPYSSIDAINATSASDSSCDIYTDCSVDTITVTNASITTDDDFF